ncbi:MAG: hypothetical protein HKO56_05340 [Bacteroidia bacterium]|nr:hypothetical protein [Bacteroidia bacterium]NNC85170.1 hypothetical protein [Bacteroidia bacterium]NNM16062.1 hypothetical protein [Bacteroidia bacterium]
METSKSIEIIESMYKESKRSLHRNSFYFILWGLLLVPAGIAEYLFIESEKAYMVWPIVGIVGGIVAGIYGFREGKRAGAQTVGDRIYNYTWGAFIALLILSLPLSFKYDFSPHILILMLAGYATFVSGGIAKFTPFILGGMALVAGSLLCAYVVELPYHGLVFAASILLGYVIPGFMLRNQENGQA